MSETRELAERLKKITHFSEIPLSGVEQIIASGEIRQYVKGAFVFHEGDESAGMFVLLNGQVNLSKLGPEGKEGILNTLEPVIMFNEVSALDGGPNPVSAYAHRYPLMAYRLSPFSTIAGNTRKLASACLACWHAQPLLTI